MAGPNDSTRLLPPDPPGPPGPPQDGRSKTPSDGASKHPSGSRNPLFLSGLQLLNLLGEGGFGSVYRAVDDRLGRVVAVKVLRRAPRPGDRERFMAEAVVTGNLQHPNILPVHNLGTDPTGRDFFSMPVVQGRTLAEVLRLLREGDKKTTEEFPLPRLIAMLVDICEAVAYAHARNVVHRDLKPANIMTGQFGEVFVLDWGLAKTIDGKSTEGESAREEHRNLGPITTETDQTLHGTIVGTPGYMAPEQATGNVAKVSYPADVYSLGVLLYEMMTLHRPPDPAGVSAMLITSSSGSRRRMRVKAGNREVPRELQAVTEKCLAFNPDKRYPNAAALVADLHAYLEDHEVSVYPDGLVKKAGRWLRRHKTAAAVGMGSLASGLLAIFMLLVLANSHARDRARLAEREHELALEAKTSAERITALEREKNDRLERHARAMGKYLPGLDLLQRAEWNAVFAEDAVKAFESALKLDSTLPEAHRAKARALTLAGRFRDAAAEYQQALTLTHRTLGHEDPEILRSLGDLYWDKLFDIDTAFVFFDRAAKADEHNPHARVAAAIVRSTKKGDMTGAIESLRKLATDNPNWWEVHESLGFHLLGQGPWDKVDILELKKNQDPAEAVKSFTKAIRLRPGYESLHRMRAMALLMQYNAEGQPSKLRDAFLKDVDSATLLAPNEIRPHLLRLQLHYQFGDKEIAIAEADELAVLFPHHPDALRDRAKVLMPLGRGKEVLADIEAAVQKKPDDAKLLLLREQVSSGKVP